MSEVVYFEVQIAWLFVFFPPSVFGDTFLISAIALLDDNHFEMPFSFRDEIAVLPNNKILAETRLTQLKKRFSYDSKYQKDYVKFMDNIIEKGYAQRMPECELN